jgi:prepilin signal peptidase PulO-like enzyme (type II secretory pathway)
MALMQQHNDKLDTKWEANGTKKAHERMLPLPSPPPTVPTSISSPARTERSPSRKTTTPDVTVLKQPESKLTTLYKSIPSKYRTIAHRIGWLVLFLSLIYCVFHLLVKSGLVKAKFNTDVPVVPIVANVLAGLLIPWLFESSNVRIGMRIYYGIIVIFSVVSTLFGDD